MRKREIATRAEARDDHVAHDLAVVDDEDLGHGVGLRRDSGRVAERKRAVAAALD
jgi:hypothetical protein